MYRFRKLFYGLALRLLGVLLSIAFVAGAQSTTGVISGTVTLAVTLISIFAAPVMGFGPWELLDVALIFGLAFGISRRSRTCAILLLIYFLISKFILLVTNPSASSVPMALVFIYFYVRAVIGTFRYHKALRAAA